MTADTGIDPVADVECAIGTDDDVRGAEERFGFAIHGVVAANEVRTGEFSLGIGGDELGAFQRESSTLWFRLVCEDRVSTGLTGKKGALPFFAERTVLIVGIPSWRTAAIDITCGCDAGILLPPFGDRGRLTGAPVCLP